MTLTTRANVIAYCRPVRVDLGFATDAELNAFLDQLITSTSAEVLRKLNRTAIPGTFAPAVENIVLRLIQLELAKNVALKTSAITSFENLERELAIIFGSKKEIMSELNAYKLIPSGLVYERVMYRHL